MLINLSMLFYALSYFISRQSGLRQAHENLRRGLIGHLIRTIKPRRNDASKIRKIRQKGEKGEGLRIALWFHSLHEKMTSIDIMKNHTINYNNKLPKLTPNNNYYMFDNLFQLGDPSGDICGSDTTMGSPKARDKSFVVSVFPVPAGPAGRPAKAQVQGLKFSGCQKDTESDLKTKKNTFSHFRFRFVWL